MTDTPHAPVSVRWARFRFQVARIAPSWTPGSRHRGHRDRRIVDTRIGYVNTGIARLVNSEIAVVDTEIAILDGENGV